MALHAARAAAPAVLAFSLALRVCFANKIIILPALAPLIFVEL
jgi:hypothetical protein